MSSLFEGLIQNIPAIFYRCQCDKHWSMLFINNAIEKLTGYPTADFINNKIRSYASIIHPEDTKKVEAAVHTAMQIREPWSTEYRLITRDNEVRWVVEMGVAIYADNGELEYHDGFIQDITERKKIEFALIASEKQIRDMAFTDSVTGLANRNLFSDRLDQIILDSSRYEHKFSLLFIDLDGFKLINDTYGHQVGDKLLSLSAERISQSFRESDVVARFGGDEFLIIAKNTSSMQSAKCISTKLLDNLAKPYYIDDLKLSVTGSIGIAIYPKHATTSSELIRKADKAMYQAKDAGRNGYVIYTEEDEQLTPDIAGALANS